MGATIRYSGSSTPLRHLEVEPLPNATFNHTLPPDTLWLKVISCSDSSSFIFLMPFLTYHISSESNFLRSVITFLLIAQINYHLLN